MGLDSTVWEDVAAYFTKLYDGFKDVNPAKNGSVSVFWIFIGLCTGIILTTVFMTVYRRLCGPLVRKLLSAAAAPDQAKTLDELGMNTPLVRMALSGNGEISRIVSCVEADAHVQAVLASSADEGRPKKIKDDALLFSYRGKWDTLHFYVSEKNAFIADEHFSEKNGRLLPMFVTIAFALLLTWVLLLVGPSIIGWAAANLVK